MKKLLIALPFVLASFNAQAEPHTYSFDTVHSQIIFFVNHLGFSNSEGEFLDFDGEFTFDPENVEASDVDVTIDTTSIDMDDEAWDKHLKNADFFDVEQFPTMTFKSTEVLKTGEKTGLMTGDLTMLGVTKPVTLDVTMNKVGEHPRSGKQHAGFSATGKLNRSDWGMDYGLPMVGDEVNIRIEVEGSAKEQQ